MSDTGDHPRAPDPRYDFSRGAAELRGEVYHPPEYLEYLERAAAAMKSIRLIVYAGLASFVILAAYGFVLIYELTSDVHAMVGEARAMTQQMQAMTRSMANLNQSVGSMQADLATMKGSMAGMEGSVARIGEAVVLMQHSATNLDRSISPFMGGASRFLPPGWPGAQGAPQPYTR